MKRIQFSATLADATLHPLHRRVVGDDPIERVELLLWSPTAEPTTLVWCAGDRAATERALADIDSLVASSLVEDGDGTYAFVQQDEFEFPAAVLALLAEAAVLVRPPVVFRHSGAVQFEAVGEAAALGDFHDELSAVTDLAIDQVHTFDRQQSPSAITDRQATALEAAVAVGYYDVPRTGTVADVAARLDCARSTAGELLRKAEAGVIRGHVDAN